MIASSCRRRPPRRTLRRKCKEEASRELAEGQVVEGTIASVTTFGLFVDVGDADGLVHRSGITSGEGIDPTTLIVQGTACVCSSRYRP
jgi:small subunit ribosomal protein S1